MFVFLSEIDTNDIIETQYINGHMFNNTVQLLASDGSIMEGSFVFSETLIFMQKLGGYETKMFDIRAMIPLSCVDNESSIRTCIDES